ncbi:MAG: 3-hydroxyacyl-ACP dehydratase FabZ family protein [Planctomycetota bacterium]|nr:3-hydroxyacyl-ACP dehydratase FabZ family protein [Planctomycetota bacterium]
MRWYWIDRFIEFESGKQAKAIKAISLAEDHLHDHFPEYPVMPKSLIIEGMAQTGGLLACEHGGFREKVVLAKITKAKFHGEAFPGDSLIYTATVEYIKKNGAMVSAVAHKGDRLHAEMEFVFAHLQEGHEDRTLFEPSAFLKMMRMLGAYEVGHDADGQPLMPPTDLCEEE